MGVFDKVGMKVEQIDEAKPIEQTDRLAGPSLNVVQIKFMKFSISTNVKHKTDGWPMFNGEFVVLDNTGGVQRGTSRSWGMLVDPGQSTSSRQAADRQVGDVKKFVAAAMGQKRDKEGKPIKDEAGKPLFYTWQDVKKSHLDAIEANPLRLEGRKLIIEVGGLKRSQSGNDFYPHDFRPYTEEEAARISDAMKETPAAQTNTPATQQGQPAQQPNIPAPEVEADSSDW